MDKGDSKTKEKIIKWVDSNKRSAEKIVDSKENLGSILSKVNEMKVQGMGPIDGLMDTIKDFLSLVHDWKDKKYTEVSKTTIVAIIGGFVYLVSPVDIIPDFIPVVGPFDDIFVI